MHEPKEEGASHHSGDRAEGEFCRHYDIPREEVRQQKRRRTAQDACWKQKTVVRPDDESDYVRYYEAHEPYDPGYRDGRAGHKRAEDYDAQMHPPRRQSEMTGLPIPEVKQVEGPGPEGQQNQPYNQEGRYSSHNRPGCTTNATQHPERDASQLVVVSYKGEHPREGPCRGVYRDSSEYKGRYFSLPAAPSHQVDDRRSDEAAKERAYCNDASAEYTETQDDSSHRPNSRPAGYADDSPALPGGSETHPAGQPRRCPSLRQPGCQGSPAEGVCSRGSRSVRGSKWIPVSIPTWLRKIENACAGGISTAPIPSFANSVATKSASMITSSVEQVRRRVAANRLNVSKPLDAIASL